MTGSGSGAIHEEFRRIGWILRVAMSLRGRSNKYLIRLLLAAVDISSVESSDDHHGHTKRNCRQADPHDQIMRQLRSAIDAGKYHCRNRAKLKKDKANDRQASLRWSDNWDAMNVGHIDHPCLSIA